MAAGNRLCRVTGWTAPHRLCSSQYAATCNLWRSLKPPITCTATSPTAPHKQALHPSQAPALLCIRASSES